MIAMKQAVSSLIIDKQKVNRFEIETLPVMLSVQPSHSEVEDERNLEAAP
jgi:hypothetical protein